MRQELQPTRLRDPNATTTGVAVRQSLAIRQLADERACSRADGIPCTLGARYQRGDGLKQLGNGPPLVGELHQRRARKQLHLLGTG